MKVVPVPVREDNYAYLLVDEQSKTAAAVDPYSVDKVAAAAESLGVSIVAAITTHHHYDHSGGNNDFAAKYPNVPIYGGSEEVTKVSNIVKDKDQFNIGDINVRCLATPCHTQDSICYYVSDPTDNDHPGGVFTGDTLFIAGCGRFFEGTADEMNKSLKYLATLPDKTIVYNGHEYTSASFAFGRHIEPEAPGMARLADLVEKHQITTGKTTIGDEKEWNVFMRLDSPTVRKATGFESEVDVMKALREQKNAFRG